jgi:hypothetical protein
MVSSQEVRWFIEGSIEQHPELKLWIESGADHPKWIGRLGGKPDAYLVIPGAADMGLKWREGQLQFKGLESSLGTQVFRGGHVGNVERWMKWSYEGNDIEQTFAGWFKNSRVVEIFKTRCLRKLRLNPFSHAASEVDSDASIDRGGGVEVTDLRVNDKAYCSVAFETFPNDSAMHEDFTSLVNLFLGKLEGVDLTEYNSMSYPAWLQTIATLNTKIS